MNKKYTQEEISLAGLVLKAYIRNKIVRKFSNTSGVLFVPRRFIGKKFKVILIPYEDVEELLI